MNLYEGEDVYQLFTKEKFLSDWDSLYNACPWATAFQSKEFTTTWYNIHHEKITPILILSYEGDKLAGLFALVRKRGRQKIYGAGIYDTEYQTWLSTTEYSDKFIANALQVLHNRFKKFEIELKYIPKESPLKWTNENQDLKYHCSIRERLRPLIQINSDIILRNLKKKNRKEKINRLKRLGELKFEKIIDLENFILTFDTIAVHYAFRKASKYNRSLDKIDSISKSFYVELFKLNLLHVSVLKLNDEIIASNVGIAGRGWVYLKGMNTWSPFYAKYSPGIIHLLMLCHQLGSEGFDAFDLTPGDDAYKETIATTFDKVYEFRYYSQKKSYLKNLIRRELYFTILRKFNSNPLAFELELNKRKEKLGTLLKSLYTLRLDTFKSMLDRGTKAAISSEMYRLVIHNYDTNLNTFRVSKNNLKDLLAYEQQEGLTKYEFLMGAVKNYEKGKHSYTITNEKKLVCCVWKDTWEGSPKLPEGAIVLTDIYCHPQRKNKEGEFIISAIDKISKEEKQNEVYLYTAKEGIVSSLKSRNNIDLSQSIP
ncbi:GNAT family N-acetyltransferase [Pontibacter sp. BT731]|uniref:GNAT family N-acetyltransferase n=1 Tax=Pontibacter coccineus TaxID=3063328 RepID=UPI0026E1F142|nr:GNAT family N-acetyltransferase [Pontibacter sp. BT731]MDO6391453.1 GNAT family N-acetyltransferase [Pontibacter sp. BT731]